MTRTALSAHAFVWLDLLLMGATFASVRYHDTKLMGCSLGFHFVAALTVSPHTHLLSPGRPPWRCSDAEAGMRSYDRAG